MHEFIDLHSHVAWHVDDGIQTFEEARLALEQAKADGIGAICSTPHVISSKITKEKLEHIQKRQDELIELGKSVGVSIYKGAEIKIYYEFLDDLDAGLCPCINGTKYMLVEFNLHQDITHIPYAKEYLQELIYRGYVPILAHVERFFPSHLDLAFIESLLQMGCVLQTNRTSLIGAHGRKAKKYAWQLIKRNWIGLVCTDAHRTVAPRMEVLSDAYKMVERKCSQKQANRLFYGNPKSILLNDDICFE